MMDIIYALLATCIFLLIALIAVLYSCPKAAQKCKSGLSEAYVAGTAVERERICRWLEAQPHDSGNYAQVYAHKIRERSHH